MVNASKLLINVVTVNKPKGVLVIRLEPKGNGVGDECVSYSSDDHALPGE
jgi:hypothetical protein